jgi:hypothetical protein
MNAGTSKIIDLNNARKNSMSLSSRDNIDGIDLRVDVIGQKHAKVLPSAQINLRGKLTLSNANMRKGMQQRNGERGKSADLRAWAGERRQR